MATKFDEFRFNYMQYVKILHVMHEKSYALNYWHSLMDVDDTRAWSQYETDFEQYNQSKKKAEKLYEVLMNQSSEIVAQLDAVGPNPNNPLFANLSIFVKEELSKRPSPDLEFEEVTFLYLLKFKVEDHAIKGIEKKASHKKINYDGKTLGQVWLKSERHYTKVISILKLTPIDGDHEKPIIQEINNELHWSASKTVLGDFIYLCKFPRDGGPFLHSSKTLPVSDLEKILNRTFSNLQLNGANPLREGTSKNPGERLKLFQPILSIPCD